MKHIPHQALWLQWLLLAVALLALVGGLSQPGQLQQSNAWLQDRITRSDWFLRKHHEVAPGVFLRPSIRSAANCAACHAGAERGDYDDDGVRIPR